MNPLELLQVTGLFLFSIITFTIFGRLIIGRINESIEDYGVYLAIGIIVYSYLTMILGVLSQFTKVNLIILLLIIFCLGLTKWRMPKLSLKWDWFGVLILTASFIMLGTVYLSSMQPPHTSDELNYHFPQAKKIVENQKIDLRFGGHFFYGNIPKQMEVIFASGLSLAGYSHAHTLHFIFLIALLVTVFGIFTKLYGFRTASLAIFLILMYDDLTWNVSSGFVDGAAFCLEIMGLLYALKYFELKKSNRDLILSGLMIGTGLTIKYSVAVTAFYIFILLIPQWKKLLYYIIPALLVAGFWYAKNMLWFNNPFYPMYLGHPGITDSEYAGLMAAIQQFGPKTISYFSHLMEYFTEIPRLPIYIALLIAPLSLFIKKSPIFTRLLFGYFALYVPYWFFLGTHQLRFFAPAAIAALLLTATVLGQMRAKWLVVIGLAMTLLMVRTVYFDQTVFSYFWSTKLHLRERQYALGNLSQDQFMHRWYGCYYDVIRYIDTLPDKGKVVDNWSYGIEFNIPFYSQYNKYILWTKQDLQAMKDFDIKYLYIRESNIAKYSERVEPSFANSILSYTEFDKFFISHSKKIKRIDDCQIYALNP